MFDNLSRACVVAQHAHRTPYLIEPLLTMAKALLRAGRAGESAEALTRAQRLATPGSDNRKEIDKLLQQAAAASAR